jgi:hypothetical protein
VQHPQLGGSREHRRQFHEVAPPEVPHRLIPDEPTRSINSHEPGLHQVVEQRLPAIHD